MYLIIKLYFIIHFIRLLFIFKIIEYLQPLSIIKNI